MLSAKQIAHFLGKNITGLITRKMGLMLPIIGVQMLLIGIQGAFKYLDTVVNKVDRIVNHLTIAKIDNYQGIL